MIQAALGSYSMDTFKAKSHDGKDLEITYQIGIYFQLIFLMVNMIVMLNFVIAILSSIYSEYENKSIGLYYMIIIELLPSMEFDENYGAIPCATMPLEFLLIPFYWLVLFCGSKNNDKTGLKIFNNVICHFLYFPLAIIQTVIFTTINTILVPLVYIIHFFRLVKHACTANRKLKRNERLPMNAYEFLFNGLIVLVTSIFTDPIRYFKNLY